MILVQVVGGLGSQMMAFSLCLALQKKYICGVICDFSWYDYHQDLHNGSELHRVFGLQEIKVHKWARSESKCNFF